MLALGEESRIVGWTSPFSEGLAELRSFVFDYFFLGAVEHELVLRSLWFDFLELVDSSLPGCRAVALVALSCAGLRGLEHLLLQVLILERHRLWNAEVLSKLLLHLLMVDHSFSQVKVLSVH